ncbi:MAG TPA: FAD-dependent oxidoreductase [Gemmatimonadales bacterium]|nr:FAD-dependent oxidoreductase [Gemmatimonadales bacterium]
MNSPNPLRVAIVGTGPSGFYAAEHLLKKHPGVEIDLIDRLPTPFGLVRGGVAPDHQKIKSVIRVYEKIASQPGVRFLGNVLIGGDLTREELLNHYHAVIYATGAQSDRPLGIPGEHLRGSHAATEFVGWYNGHPDYQDHTFDLSQKNVVVIGVGNVAVDVTRVLSRTPEELAKTDVAAYALDALRNSGVKNVYMIGRRGPVQAAFTNPELKELGEMPGADIVVLPNELALDEGSRGALAKAEERTAEKNLHTLEGFAAKPQEGKPMRIHLRFLLSPLELHGDGRVEAVMLSKNRLVPSANGELRAEPTGETEVIPAGLVFRSVGYLGTGIPGVVFDARRGIVPNEEGRVVTAPGVVSQGEYVVGWIKRGPTGVIGTNKPDATETTDHVLEDFTSGKLERDLSPRDDIDRMLAQRGVRVVTWNDWRKLDQIERERGATLGRPRLKFTTVAEMLGALG